MRLRFLPVTLLRPKKRTLNLGEINMHSLSFVVPKSNNVDDMAVN